MNSTHNNDKMYFYIKINQSGLTDQLMQFCCFHVLGYYMNLSYLHLPLHSHRSETSFFAVLAGKIERKLINRRIQLCSKPGDHGFVRLERVGVSLLLQCCSSYKRLFMSDIFDFLGINAAFFKRSSKWPEDYEVVEVVLSDEILLRASVEDFDGLIKYVSGLLQKRGRDAPVIADFSLAPGGGRRFFRFLLSHLNYDNKSVETLLNLRDMYRDARQLRPHPDKYEPNKTRLLVHIRQGDTAVLNTPWGTLLPVRAGNNRFMRECYTLDSAVREEYGNDVFRPGEVYRVVKKLVCDDLLPWSCLVFSDGYSAAFRKVFTEGKRLISKEKRKNLKAYSRKYAENEFGIFRNIPGVKLFVGEDREKLKNLIHSVFLADVIVTTSQQRMIPKLVSFYFNGENMPLLIILHKGVEPDWSDLFVGRPDKLVFFSVEEGRCQELKTRIKRHSFSNPKKETI